MGGNVISARNCLAYLTRPAGAGLPVRRPGNGAKLDSMTVNPDEGHGSA